MTIAMSYDFDHVVAEMHAILDERDFSHINGWSAWSFYAAQGEWDSRRNPTGTPAAIPLGQVTPCFFNGLVLATIYAILMDRL